MVDASVFSSPTRGKQPAQPPPPRLPDEEDSEHAFAALAEHTVSGSSKSSFLDESLQTFVEFSGVPEDDEKQTLGLLRNRVDRVFRAFEDEREVGDKLLYVLEALMAYDTFELLRRNWYLDRDRPKIRERIENIEIVLETEPENEEMKEASEMMRKRLKDADRLHSEMEKRYESSSSILRMQYIRLAWSKEGFDLLLGIRVVNNIFPKDDEKKKKFRVPFEHYDIDLRGEAEGYQTALNNLREKKKDSAKLIPAEARDALKQLFALLPTWSAGVKSALKNCTDLDLFLYLVGEALDTKFGEGAKYFDSAISQVFSKKNAEFERRKELFEEKKAHLEMKGKKKKHVEAHEID